MSTAASKTSSDSSDNSLDKPTYVFDNCGFKVEAFQEIDRFEHYSYIIPSEEFHNISEFFEYIKIPFYDGYQIRIQNETDDNCYNYSFLIKINLVFIVSIFTYLL